jgi:hypothetical protein
METDDTCKQVYECIFFLGHKLDAISLIIHKLFILYCNPKMINCYVLHPLFVFVVNALMS